MKKRVERYPFQWIFEYYLSGLWGGGGAWAKDG